jgi:CubicO group peptidase (beta-lactamase class C family)
MKKLSILISFTILCGILSQSCTQKNSSPNSFGQIAKRAIDSVPSLGSLLIWKNNELVYEEYFNGANRNTDFDVKSVTKSVTSAIIGIIYDKGWLPDVNTPVLTIFPEFSGSPSEKKNIWYSSTLKTNDSLRKLLTFKHLLTMQAGFLWDDNNPIIHRPFQSSSDPVRFMLELPFESPPGTEFKYCTGACQVVMAILEKSSKIEIRKLADSLLFDPLGIKIKKWTVDEVGRLSAGSSLMMKPMDMIHFGQLYLNEGEVNNKRILSKKWIDESTSEKVVLNEWDVLPEANGYGYYWWRRKTRGHQCFVASGYGGQLICVIPDLKTIVVTTCFVNEKNRGRSEIKRLHSVIDQIVDASI